MPCGSVIVRRLTACIMGSACLLALPPAAGAALFNGAPAIDLLGQYDDSLTDPQPVYTKSGANNGPNRLGINTPYGNPVIDSERHRLFVADSTNNRILVYNLHPDHTLIDRIPDYVLGQPDFHTSTAGVSAANMSFPIELAFDAARDYLFVTDHYNHRILVFNVSSLHTGMQAQFVIGQNNFGANAAATTQSGLRLPWGVTYDGSGGVLFVSDRDNNRVLAFSGTLSTGMNAWRVLGQPDFTSSGALTTQSGMNNPRGLAYDTERNRLFVGEYNNHRVLVFTGSALANGMNAANVLGQTLFTANGFARTQSRLFNPGSLAYSSSGSRLFVADTSNQRVLMFDMETIVDGENATHVLGQVNFTNGSAANTQIGFSSPRGIHHDESANRLYVTQVGNHRVSIFDVTEITDGEPAVDLLGQYDDSLTDPQPVYTKRGTDNGPNILGFSLNNVAISQIAIDEIHHRLFVSDTFNNRVLVYNLDAQNQLIEKMPAHVLGQSNFYTSTAATTQSGMWEPNGIAYDSSLNRLFVVCTRSSRVLVYDVTEITNGEDAVYVLGQTNFLSTSAATSQNGLNWSRGIAFDSKNQRLFVGDTGNNRVLVYVFTGGVITNGMNGSYVLGQSSFITMTSGLTRNEMNSPYGLTYDPDGERLFVVDTSNARVLMFDVSSIINGEDAVHVLGQPDFTSNSSGVFSAARALTYDDNHQRLFVTSLGHHRVLIYDVASISDGEDPIYVLGQPNFSSISAATTIDGMRNPQGVIYDHTNDRLYVADRGNNRIMIFDVSPEVPATPAAPPDAPLTRPGGGRGSLSPGRGGDAPAIDPARRIVLPRQAETVSPLYFSPMTLPPAPAAVSSPVRDRLVARIERRIAEKPALRTMLLKLLERLDRRLAARRGG